MTDEELAAIRERESMRHTASSRTMLHAVEDRSVLLREVDRLRVELAGKRAGEADLAAIRAYADSKTDGQTVALSGKEARRLLAHIDYLEGAVIDLLNVDGRALREAGAAEERRRLVAVVREEADNRRGVHPGGASLLDSMADQMEVATPLPDLPPPQEARAALDAERRKVATLRAACERIAADPTTSLRPFGAANDMRDIARAAVEAAKDA